MKIHRERLRIVTHGEFDVVDITADVEKVLVSSEIEEGFALVYSPHTTCGVFLQEKEDCLLFDIEGVLRRLVPKGDYYRHDDWDIRTQNLGPNESRNAHSHLRQLLASRASECIPVSEASLQLGTWQRIMMVELDRARTREILIQVCGV